MTDPDEEFRSAVNTTAGELEKWLETEESRAVGQKKSDNTESVGHDSGRKIVKLPHTRKGDLTEADEAHMRR